MSKQKIKHKNPTLFCWDIYAESLNKKLGINGEKKRSHPNKKQPRKVK